MGGRTKPNWGVFVGGPLDGQHVLMPAGVRAAYTHYTSDTPGRRTPHEYAATGERRAMTPWKQQAPVFRFVRALPDEPAPPAPKYGLGATSASHLCRGPGAECRAG